MSAGSILVVDDSPSKRYVIRSYLRRAGYTVTEAETGGDALRQMAQAPAELVVLDVRLPDMSGFEVCALIKSHPAYAATPVVHISASAVENVDRTQGIASGADAYLVEPFDPEELLATVHAILRYYRGRQHAERLAARLSVLARMTVALNAARSATQLLHEAAAGTATIFQGPAIVCVEHATEGWLVATCEGPDLPSTVQPWAPGPELPALGQQAGLPIARLGIGPLANVQTLHLATAAPRPSRNPVYIGVPDEVVDSAGPVLTLVAQAVAGALEVQRTFAAEHLLALTLQRSLLPRQLPRVAGLDVAKRYLPANEFAEIGGDFYELCELDDRVAVAVGDVGGHSLHAATVMAELRHAMRAYLIDGYGPAEVLSRLNTLMVRLLPGEIATVCLLTLDPSTGAVRLANAGHPPPLLIGSGQVTRITEHDSLLGLPSQAMSERTLTLPAGGTLVLYTDGLVERRGETIDVGLDRLAAAAQDPDPDLDSFCDRLVREVGPQERLDDIALVAVRRRL